MLLLWFGILCALLSTMSLHRNLPSNYYAQALVKNKCGKAGGKFLGGQYLVGKTPRKTNILFDRKYTVHCLPREITRRSLSDVCRRIRMSLCQIAVHFKRESKIQKAVDLLSLSTHTYTTQMNRAAVGQNHFCFH